MTIELRKDIKLYEMEFVGEVDFFEESPYIKLLQNFKTEKELIEELENKNMPESAIKNIIQKLTDLKVLENGNIQNIKDGFPEKEYGKYTLEIFSNDALLPFVFKNKDIKREKAVSRNTADNIKQDKSYIKMVQDKTNNKFRINSISNHKAKLNDKGSEQLLIRLDNYQWKYRVNDKIYDMNAITNNELFKGKWDEKEESLKVTFDEIKEQNKFLETFECSYSEDINIENYGYLKGRFQFVPIIPKTKEDAKQWFIHLLKQEIENINSYISKEELEYMWFNLIERKSRLKKFNLVFDFESILKEFGKSSKYYWLLKAGIDLYPFDNSLVPKNKVILEEQNDIDLDSDFFQKFNISYPEELIIIDRWIVNLVQYQGLAKILESLGNPKVKIITQKLQDKKNTNAISDIINKYNIQVIEKDKKEIVHQRYWIFDNTHIYQTSESLDFITIIKDKINIKYTTFLQYEYEDLDPNLIKMEMN